MDVNDDRKWYETILFIVAAAVAGTMICCCALCLCVRIQSDKSRRRIARPTRELNARIAGPKILDYTQLAYLLQEMLSVDD